jgi:arabinogalactan endo-1,4-beta-galactosidase
MPANPLVTTYDPKRVIITFGGVPIGGFADGTFIQVDPNSESFTKKVGADGEVTRSMSNDNTHTVVITLQQSSLSNQYLSTCKNADRLTGLGMLPLNITDLNGASLFFWPQAWISTDPGWGYAKENTDRAWTFQTGQRATQNEGGTIL